MRHILEFLLALAATACSPSGQHKDGSHPPHGMSQLAPGERGASTLTPRFLVGYWDHDQACHSGAGTFLRADGSYSMNDGSGRWSFEGDSLTIVEQKPPSVRIFQARIGDAGRSRVEKVGPTTISVSWDGGGKAQFHLCDPS